MNASQVLSTYYQDGALPVDLHYIAAQVNIIAHELGHHFLGHGSRNRIIDNRSNMVIEPSRIHLVYNCIGFSCMLYCVIEPSRIHLVYNIASKWNPRSNVIEPSRIHLVYNTSESILLQFFVIEPSRIHLVYNVSPTLLPVNNVIEPSRIHLVYNLIKFGNVVLLVIEPSRIHLVYNLYISQIQLRNAKFMWQIYVKHTVYYHCVAFHRCTHNVL